MYLNRVQKEFFNEIKIIFFNERPPLDMAIRTKNKDIVQLLLSHDKIDVNACSIL